MSDDHPGEAVSAIRAEFELAEREISRISAVLDRLETRADRAGRGVTDPDAATAVDAFERYVVGTDAPGIPGDRDWRTPDEPRSDTLSYLTRPLLDGASVFESTQDIASSDVQRLASDLETYVDGGDVEAVDLVSQFETLVDSADSETLASLVSFTQRVVRAARRYRDERRKALDGADVDPGGTASPQTNPNADGESSPGAGGALGDFFADVSDEFAVLEEQPIALLPVRLETRFVSPNAESVADATWERFVESLELRTDVDEAEAIASENGPLAGFNRTAPADQELRVRVYPDQIHVDSHEPELTATEERWGKNFWAQLWYASHPSTDARFASIVDYDVTRTRYGSLPPTDVDVPQVVDYDETQVPAALQGVVADLDEGWQERFSTDDATRHREIKERAWGQLVERFDRERGAWLVHALAPPDADAMLVGWADGTAPWPPGEAPDLSFPDLDARPGSWSRQPTARLLPDRWLAVGEWRPADEPDADTTTVRVTGDPIQQPLPVGPNPESVAGEETAERAGTAPEGMEWMVDWEAARDVGMGLTITPADLDGENPGEVVFETLLVVGVKATMDGQESSDALESLLASHHYTDGLELLRRGTPTNNHDVASGYVKNPPPEETVDVECGPPRTEFGDLSDGDLLSRALGIAEPGDTHVFAHVDGADIRSQAVARHMNSVLWPGTIGYYVRNVLVPNQWTAADGLWADSPEFPSDPLGALGNQQKWLDAWRRHFIRYVRAGGPFPPIRVGSQPYGVLPVERLWSGRDGDGPPFFLPDDVDVADPGDQAISTAYGDVDLTDERRYREADVTAADFETVGTDEEITEPVEDVDETAAVQPEIRSLDADTVGSVSRTGYAVSIAESADQTDADLYGSVFDPGTPTDAEDADDVPELSDGGTTVSHLRRRAFRIDDSFPAELASWLWKFTDGWEDAVGSVTTVDDASTGSQTVEEILGHDASVDDYVREGIAGFEDAMFVQASYDVDVLGLHEDRTAHVRSMLRANDMDTLDPRLAHMFSTDSLGMSWPANGDMPIRTVASDRAPNYLGHLYDWNFEFVREMGYELPLADLTPNRQWAKEHGGYGDGTDYLLDEQLALDMILRMPERGHRAVRTTIVNSIREGSLRVGIAAGREGSLRVGTTPGGLKLAKLLHTDGDALQHTLFKQVTRFSTLQAYLASRIRLGVKWDESRLLSQLQRLDDGAGQPPVPDPSVHGAATTTVWELLSDDPLPYHQYDSFAELLHQTCAPGKSDEPAADPRMREFFDGLAALESRSASDLRRLLTETLDTASHRLDAWWTSLATRRLFERRERQEVARFEGDVYSFVGDQFPTGEDPGAAAEEETTGETGPYGHGAIPGDTDTPVSGGTMYGYIENNHYNVAEGVLEPMAEALAGPGEPVTYVGAYAFVENLHSDQLDAFLPGVDSASGGREAEYVHAPSPQHARTAAILRSARKNHDGDEDLEALLDVDLSPGRVRAAKHVLQGVRQGQQLGALLGYRFERRLRQRTKAYNERNGDSINLVKLKFALREKYPAFEGQLDHGEGETGNGDGDGSAGIGTESAKSDVLDGYRLLTNWQEAGEDKSSFLAAIEYEIRDGTSTDLGTTGETTDLDSYLSERGRSDARSEFLAIFREMERIVDAVTDLLLSESVHQLGKGNFERAGGNLDDLVKGKPVPEPEVAQTPRDDVGVTHRLGVVFGDPETATTPDPWSYRSPVVEPDDLPPVQTESDMDDRSVSADLYLQARADGERNLNAWLGSLLPDPARVSCGASISWTDRRAVDVGTFTLPTDPGTVSVSDLDVSPDLVVLSVPHAVTGSDARGAAGAHGWTHCLALQGPDGTVEQLSTSVGIDLDDGMGSGRVSDDAFHLHVHDADVEHGDYGELSGSVTFTPDGFDVELTTVEVPESTPGGATVTYRAYALGNAASAEIGRFETPTEAGPDTVSLDVDADHLVLFGNTAATAADDVHETTDAVGLSHGVVTERDGTVTQHAVASSTDPTTGTGLGGVHDDEALHLVYGSGESIAGTTAASVDGLGTTVDLTYDSVHAGDASDAARVVTYVAIETPERVPEPAVGILEGSRSEGDRVTVSTDFEPGYVEFVSAPGVSGTGTDGPVPAGGFAHGVATGVGRQLATSYATRPDGQGGVVHAGTATEGHALSIPWPDADGSVSGHDRMRIASVGEDGFSVMFPSVEAGDQVVCYRAWPAVPSSVTHVVEAGVSLDDLALSPLDAVALSQTNQQAGASQLEQRMHYQLLRHPPDSDPPVPDDATVELLFGESAPDAPEDAVPVGAFLETVRELDQLVADGRPLDATDLGHPSETEREGYTDETRTDLQGRADDAQDRLAAAGSLVENRVELLDVDADETRLTEHVATLEEHLRAFHRDVPIDGLTAVSSRVADALSEDEDALIDELDELGRHLPAGPTDRSRVDAPFTVASRPDQQLTAGTRRANTDVTVEVWSTSGVEWFEKGATATTDDDGDVTVTMDFGDVTPGAGFVVYVRTGSDLLLAEPGRVLPPANAVTVRPDGADVVRAQAATDEGTTLDVSITPEGAATSLVSRQTETEADGWFEIEVDVGALDPWDVFVVSASDGDDEVYRSVGYVEPDAVGVLDDSEVLGPLLWLADRADAFDPHGTEGPVPDLHRTVTADVDWDAVRAECELMADLHAKTGGDGEATPAARDVEAVASLVDIERTSLAGGQWDEGQNALELLDLTALDAAVDKVARALSGMAVDELFDVTGRPDRAEGLQFWANRAAMAHDPVLTRFEGFRTHPNGVFDETLPDVGFAPSLEAVFSDVADDAYPRGVDDATRFLAYLRPFLRAMPVLVEDSIVRGTLADPEGFARTLHAVAFHPTAIPSGPARSSFVADLSRLTHTPVLDGALVSRTIRARTPAYENAPLERVLERAGVDEPYYNRDAWLLGPVDGEGDADGNGDSDDSGDGDGFGDLTGIDFDDVFVDPTDFRLPSLVVNGPKDTPTGTVLTDFRYLLEQFRRTVLPDYLGSLDDGSLPPDEDASRSAYARAISNRATTLDDIVESQAGHVRAGRDVGQFAVAFRRGVLESLRRGMLRVSYFGIYGSTPQSVRGGTRDDLETLLGQARGVLASVRERYERADALAQPGSLSVDGQRERLRALFGDEYRILPTFQPANGPELSSTFGRSSALQGENPLAAETWLQRVARVRDGPATFRRALTYAESLTGERHRALEVGQLPHRESELWVGLDGEDPSPGRLSLVAQFGAGFDGQFADGPISGLFVDEHVENVPGETETTGVALNYDDPDVTAPQSIMIALPPDDGDDAGGTWTREALEDVVTDTRRLMRLRMVDFQDLSDYGALLPMLVFPNNSEDPPDAPSMDVDRIAYYAATAPDPTEYEDFWDEEADSR